MTITIDNFDFGRIDAKREIINASSDEDDIFVRSFIQPARFRQSDFHDSTKCFIVGLKGTGKTALLRYIELREIKEYRSITDFILFKSDLSEQDRRDLSKSAGYEIVDDERQKATIQQDFEQIWILFIAQIIAKHLRKTDEYKNHVGLIDRFVDFIGALNFSPTERRLRLLPDMKDNRIEVGIDTGVFEARFSSEVEFNKTRKTVSLSSCVGYIHTLLEAIGLESIRLRIFIDELELPYGDQEAFDRDARLIRDMIVVVGRFNDVFRRRNTPIQILTAIRSEVLRSVSSLGKEVNKDVEDLGFVISWDQRIRNNQHPLLEIVQRRINASEQKSGVEPSDDVWLKYFPTHISGNDTRYFLLHNGWFRPRDIVRLLRGAQDVAGERAKFNQRDFEEALKRFSEKAWIEHTEELQAGYSVQDIQALKRLLQGFRKRFLGQDWSKNCDEKKRYPRVKELLGKKDPIVILEDLFRLGIVGNDYNIGRGAGTERRQRWVFRGDQEIDDTKRIAVHRGLWRELSLE